MRLDLEQSKSELETDREGIGRPQFDSGSGLEELVLIFIGTEAEELMVAGGDQSFLLESVWLAGIFFCDVGLPHTPWEEIPPQGRRRILK